MDALFDFTDTDQRHARWLALEKAWQRNRGQYQAKLEEEGIDETALQVAWRSIFWHALVLCCGWSKWLMTCNSMCSSIKQKEEQERHSLCCDWNWKRGELQRHVLFFWPFRQKSGLDGDVLHTCPRWPKCCALGDNPTECSSQPPSTQHQRVLEHDGCSCLLEPGL